jgi:hypothetical protein
VVRVAAAGGVVVAEVAEVAEVAGGAGLAAATIAPTWASGPSVENGGSVVPGGAGVVADAAAGVVAPARRAGRSEGIG